MNRLLFVALCALALSGCASALNTPAFSPVFPDNQADAIGAVVTRLPAAHTETAPTNALHSPLVVATTHGAGRRLFAADARTGETKWSVELDAMTRPEILGDVVVTSNRENVIGLDLRNGQRLWTIALDSLAYLGTARDGETLFVVRSIGAGGGATRRGIVTAINARSGSRAWEREVTGVLGRPAAQAGFLFVPWDRQNLAVLNASDGVEIARLRSTDDVIGWVNANASGVYYGHRGAYRFDARSASGTQQGSTTWKPGSATVREGNNDPALVPDGFSPTPGTRSARGRIRYYFAPAPGGEETISLLNDTVYFTYFRYVFALDRAGVAKWARKLEDDVIEGEVTPQGLIVVGERGNVTLLDAATGASSRLTSLNAELASATLDAAGVTAAGETQPATNLRTALTEIALDPDNRLVPARAFAIKLLARLDEPEITRDLLDLYSQRSTTNALREGIAAALLERHSGGEFLTQALQRHYDFIENTASPPLKAIVPALVAANERGAVPGLLEQLADPATSTEDIALVVDALVRLGGADVIAPLKAFLVLYQADSAFRENPQALVFASEGLFRHGGDAERALLQKLAAATTSPEPVRTTIAGLFENEAATAEARRVAEARAAEQALRDAAARAYDELPTRLTQEMVNGAFGTHVEPIRACIVEELGRNAQLAQVRFAFIINNDGTAREYTFAPNNEAFVNCVRPHVTAVEFPRFKQARQRGSFTIAVRGERQVDSAAVAERRAAEQDAQSWWARNARLANNATMPAESTALPWWVRRQGTASQTTQQPAQATQPAQPTQTAQPQQPATTDPNQPAQPQQPQQPQQPAQPAQPENQWWLPQD